MLNFGNLSRRLHRRRAFGVAAVLVGMVAVSPAWARPPAGLDTSLDRTSDQGVFRVHIQSQVAPLPLWRVHQWTVHITDPSGLPVSDVELGIDGGMPQHHHGLPTAPRATPAATPGDYVVNGVKFSMTGWWVLKLTMKAPDGRTDRITFNVIL